MHPWSVSMHSMTPGSLVLVTALHLVQVLHSRRELFAGQHKACTLCPGMATPGLGHQGHALEQRQGLCYDRWREEVSACQDRGSEQCLAS